MIAHRWTFGHLLTIKTCSHGRLFRLDGTRAHASGGRLRWGKVHPGYWSDARIFGNAGRDRGYFRRIE